jgi:hypothetical protein
MTPMQMTPHFNTSATLCRIWILRLLSRNNGSFPKESASMMKARIAAIVISASFASTQERPSFQHRMKPAGARVAFWLQELRTPELLAEVAQGRPRSCRRIAECRPLLCAALAGELEQVADGLHEEEKAERERDRQYWSPLRRESAFLRPSIRAR